MKLALSALLTATIAVASPLLNAQDEETIDEEPTERICLSIRAIRSFDPFSNKLRGEIHMNHAVGFLIDAEGAGSDRPVNGICARH